MNSNLLRDKLKLQWYEQQIRNLSQKVEFESALLNMLPQLATLYFVARQVGHKRGNTCNNVFQLECSNVARQVDENCCPYYRTLLQA